MGKTQTNALFHAELPLRVRSADGWLAEAGWLDSVGRRVFRPTVPAYRSTAGTILIELSIVETVGRNRGFEKGFRGFDRVRRVKNPWRLCYR
jgi:hypothetical protein